jgi:hypothetical protein
MGHLGRSGTLLDPQNTPVTLGPKIRTVQQGTKSNGYRDMGPGERVRSVNEQPSNHRVVSGQPHNAQTPANRPLTHVHTTRCVLELDAPEGAQQGTETESNGYRGMGPG